MIQKLLKRYRETGSYAPKTRRVQTPPKLNQEQLEVLAKIVDHKDDATLSEIQEKLAEQTGVVIGISSEIVWEEKEKVTRRAMHEAIFEAGLGFRTGDAR